MKKRDTSERYGDHKSDFITPQCDDGAFFHNSDKLSWKDDSVRNKKTKQQDD